VCVCVCVCMCVCVCVYPIDMMRIGTRFDHELNELRITTTTCFDYRSLSTLCVCVCVCVMCVTRKF